MVSCDERACYFIGGVVGRLEAKDMVGFGKLSENDF